MVRDRSNPRLPLSHGAMQTAFMTTAASTVRKKQRSITRSVSPLPNPHLIPYQSKAKLIEKENLKNAESKLNNMV